MKISRAETAAAAAGVPVKALARAHECSIRSNSQHFGRGWFACASWPAGERFFTGINRRDAVQQATEYAERVLGYDSREIFYG